jgi:hypothetical protein
MRDGTTSQQLGNVLSKDKDIVKVGPSTIQWALTTWLEQFNPNWKIDDFICLAPTLNIDKCIVVIDSSITKSKLLNKLIFYASDGAIVDYSDWSREGSLSSQFHSTIRALVMLRFRDCAFGAELEVRRTATGKMVRLHLSTFDVNHYFGIYIRNKLGPSTTFDPPREDEEGTVHGLRPTSVKLPVFQLEPLEYINGLISIPDIIGRVGLSGKSVELPTWLCNYDKRNKWNNNELMWQVESIENLNIEAIWGRRRASRNVPAIWIEELQDIDEKEFLGMHYRIGLDGESVDWRLSEFKQENYGQLISSEMLEHMKALEGRKGNLHIGKSTGKIDLMLPPETPDWEYLGLVDERQLLKGAYLRLKLSMPIIQQETPQIRQSIRNAVESLSDNQVNEIIELGRERPEFISRSNRWLISFYARHSSEGNNREVDPLSIVSSIMEKLEWNRTPNLEGMIQLTESVTSLQTFLEGAFEMDEEMLFKEDPTNNISNFADLHSSFCELISYFMMYLSECDGSKIYIKDVEHVVDELKEIIEPYSLTNHDGNIVGYSTDNCNILLLSDIEEIFTQLCKLIEIKATSKEYEIFKQRYLLTESIGSNKSVFVTSQ